MRDETVRLIHLEEQVLKSLLASCMLEPIFKSWVIILGPPLTILKAEKIIGFYHFKLWIGLCKASLAHPS